MSNKGKVLITGGSGLVGTRLTEMLLQNQYHVVHLGRRASDGPVKTYAWDASKGMMDERAFEGVNVVINLAGANVSGKRWTDTYKKELVDSRVKSTKLLLVFLNNKRHTVTNFISGSAIGYYGACKPDQWIAEEDKPGTDFLATLVQQWEATAIQTTNTIKTSIVRIGIVLSERGGAFVEMAKPVRMGFGAALGTGEQVVSWIHIDDLCRLFIHILENNLTGVFNAAAPEPASNAELTGAIAKALHKSLWLPNVPGFVLKIVLGEMASAVLTGSRVSAGKIVATGFRFRFGALDEAVGR